MLYYVGDHDGQRRFIPGLKRDDLTDEDIAAAVDLLGAESPEQARAWLIRSGGWSAEAPDDPNHPQPAAPAPGEIATP